MNPTLFSLLHIELLKEIRNKYMIAGLLVYELSCVLLVKFLIQFSEVSKTQETALMALFWLTVLFSVVNAVVSSFQKEPEGRMFYYRWAIAPEQFIVSKLVFNFLFAVLLSLLGFVTFYAMVGFELQNFELFLATIALSCGGYSIIFTTVGAVAMGTKNAATLTAILGLPLIIPMLAFIAKLSLASFEPALSGEAIKNLLLLLVLDCLIGAFTYVLFPYIWRD
ncbi:MAG: heme exporter protein CcmB [Chitinophagales bacterium]|nr:heme exporter protein CcmB [Chitinophagales bacterium]